MGKVKPVREHIKTNEYTRIETEMPRREIKFLGASMSSKVVERFSTSSVIQHTAEQIICHAVYALHAWCKIR